LAGFAHGMDVGGVGGESKNRRASKRRDRRGQTTHNTDHDNEEQSYTTTTTRKGGGIGQTMITSKGVYVRCRAVGEVSRRKDIANRMPEVGEEGLEGFKET